MIVGILCKSMADGVCFTEHLRMQQEDPKQKAKMNSVYAKITWQLISYKNQEPGRNQYQALFVVEYESLGMTMQNWFMKRFFFSALLKSTQKKYRLDSKPKLLSDKELLQHLTQRYVMI